MDNLSKARNAITTHNVDAIFFTTQDEFLSEFTKPENNDVLCGTGFSGSNGYALLTKTKNILFTDGRYLLQAKNELPSSFEVQNISAFTKSLKEEGISSLALNFARVSAQFVKKLHSVLPQLKLVHLKEILSEPFSNNGTFYEVEAGRSSKEKLEAVAKYLTEASRDGFFIADAQNTCWLLNIRGNDEHYTPVCKITLFVKNNGSYEINPDLTKITGSILVDTQTTFLQWNTIPAEKQFDDFITNTKAIKNDAEIEGIINAHKIDGKILTQFFTDLETNYHGKTEVQIAEELLACRKSHSSFNMLSFATICGCNENGAIIHYHAKPEITKTVTEESVLLIDSGGQFYGKNILGTTDITRTVYLGNNPSADYKKAFTLVLKGHIAVATAVFNEATPSNTFDHLARKFLKEHGMDYAHSTGHGVGAFLSVHEAGCGISFRSEKPLKEGMLLSNEPGYYLEGKFGIRIENLILVCKNAEGDLFFETITLVPIQEKSIDFTLLTKEEKSWLEAYNKKCIEILDHNL